MTIYVPSCFRHWLLSTLPGLRTNPGYLRLFHYLLAGEFVDGESGELVIPAGLLAEFEGKVAQFRGGNYVAAAFLDSFRRDVLPDLTVRDWRYRDKRARTVSSRGLPADVVASWDAMNADVLRGSTELVDMFSGRKWTRQREADHQRLEAAAIGAAARAVDASPLTLDIIDYQNGLAPHAFSRAVKTHLAEAVSVAESLPDSVSRQRALTYLARIAVRPKPLLRAVADSPRPFGTGMSLLGVKSSVRRVLTQGWVDYDLKNAQLAIVAREWGIEELQAFLASGQSIWSFLTESLDVPASAKPVLKTAVYSLLFGRPKGRISASLDAESGLPGLGQRFFSLPLMKVAYRAREGQLKRVKSDHGGSTSLGKTIPIPYGSGRPAEWVAGARSILAQQAQAVELQLVHPVYVLARTTKAFDIMLYQFDGFTVKYRDKRNCALWHQRILAEVDRHAANLGVHTRLEHEPGASFDWDLG